MHDKRQPCRSQDSCPAPRPRRRADHARSSKPAQRQRLLPFPRTPCWCQPTLLSCKHCQPSYPPCRFLTYYTSNAVEWSTGDLPKCARRAALPRLLPHIVLCAKLQNREIGPYPLRLDYGAGQRRYHGNVLALCLHLWRLSGAVGSSFRMEQRTSVAGTVDSFSCSRVSRYGHRETERQARTPGSG